ncbi:hypothetical protein [Herbaspirillum camelliae]|uniref:hypothetical protein n=1 Tax=Herbaspirillum camelliae TaxID=1892903 RepID=UPI000949D6BA|nr:hypothetical protein [Herbaspirillum camelliae]
MTCLNLLIKAIYGERIVIFCYVVAAIVGIAVAVVELLSRYGSGNKPSWILWGIPQAIYYLINGAAAAIGLFVSESLEQTKLIELYGSHPGEAIIKIVGVSVGAMFVLRSSLFAVGNKEGQSKVDVGPAQIINVLNQYLDFQIDKARSAAAVLEVSKLLDTISPDLFYPDLVLIAITATEVHSKDVLEKLKTDMELLYANKDWKSPRAKNLAMALRISKLLGARTLEHVLTALSKVSESVGAAEAGSRSTSGVNSQDPDVALDEMLQLLQQKSPKSSAGADSSSGQRENPLADTQNQGQQDTIGKHTQGLDEGGEKQ